MPDERGFGTREVFLLAVVFVAATCGLAYELVIGATGSYIAGDSVRQFAITIGLFLSSMGVGSFLSRFITSDPLRALGLVEVSVGFFGGLTHPLLYVLYATGDAYRGVLLFMLVVVGTLVGLEIPLVLRSLENRLPLRINVASVLGIDYLGALVVSVVFPLVMLPSLGLWYSSLFFGLLNVLAGLAVIVYLVGRPLWWRGLIQGVVAFLGLLALWAAGGRAMAWVDAKMFTDEVIHSEQSRYQKIVLTRWRNDLRMFLNGNLQFSSVDEYRYHEMLVHPVMSMVPSHTRVLVLGGGDGLALREIFKYSDVKHVDLVDLDPAVVRLAKTIPDLRRLNRDSFRDPRVTYHARDAWLFVHEGTDLYDVVIVDLPDPNVTELGKVYSREFYGAIARRLARHGAMVVQATSPFFNPGAFWCIEKTIRSAGLQTLPIHGIVPSFGDWGFVIAARYRPDPERMKVTVPTRFLTPAVVASLPVFGRDLVPRPDLQVSTVDHPVVIDYYLDDYARFYPFSQSAH